VIGDMTTTTISKIPTNKLKKVLCKKMEKKKEKFFESTTIK